MGRRRNGALFARALSLVLAILAILVEMREQTRLHIRVLLGLGRRYRGGWRAWLLRRLRRWPRAARRGVDGDGKLRSAQWRQLTATVAVADVVRRG